MSFSLKVVFEKSVTPIVKIREMGKLKTTVVHFKKEILMNKILTCGQS